LHFEGIFFEDHIGLGRDLCEGSAMLSRVVIISWVFISPLFSQNLTPDFSLPDKNLSSPRAGVTVSPRNYRHQVTAYYFGSAT